MSLYRIHLPLQPRGYAGVLINKEKSYGGVSGFDLLTKYKNRPRPKPEPQPLRIENDNLIFIPSELPEQIIIHNQTMNTREFFDRIQEGTGLKVISKRELRPLKQFMNCTLRIW
jgi:hypothetical protein